ncbi:DUF2291 family protein [Naumannella halotolerans]|uniref:Putative lipoprotein DUF2291 n=1 Tax=Naumannella halotolerans TaxID=993414 RepID=A0A4R7J5Q1_9ACTN|nr:DUF2291 family protein [Naumannella halotolerans]TDT32544.1 putative lipoprotein DUF2291 [Naumannella halotolerans]
MPRNRSVARRNLLLRRGIAAAVGVVLLVAMILNTNFLTAAQVEELGPETFDPVATADELWQQAGDLSFSPVGEVLTAVQEDPQAAAEEFGAQEPSEGSYVFAVEFSGTVTEADGDTLRLEVDGAPERTPLLLPVGTAVNGTVLRDALGFRFADAPGQTEFQYVGDELKRKMLEQVEAQLPDPASAAGKQITGTGVIAVALTGDSAPPEAKPVNIQPVEIEVSE